MRRILLVLAVATLIVALLVRTLLTLNLSLTRTVPLEPLRQARLPYEWLIAGAVVLIIICWPRSGERASRATTHGSARFASRHETATLALPRRRWLRWPALWRRGARVNGDLGDAILPPGALLLAPGEDGQALHLPLAVAFRHTLVVAGSGTGKTRALVLPNCAAMTGHSFVVTDPKSEAWRLTGGLHRGAIRYAPREPEASAPFNWIPACRDERLVELLARAAVQDHQGVLHSEGYWHHGLRRFVTALFAHAAQLPVPTPATVMALLGAPHLLELLAESPAAEARLVAAHMQTIDGKARGSIMMDAANRLSFLADPRVRRVTSASLEAPDFRPLRERPGAVYWCLHERDLAPLQGLSALFWTYLLDQLMESEGLPVSLILDEFGNLGRIPNFEVTVSVARGRGVSLLLVAQSLGQIEAQYDKTHAQTIRESCATKITLGGGVDLATAKLFAEMSGEETRVIETASRRAARDGWLGGTETSYSQQHVRRTLLTADEVRRLPQGRVLVVTTNQPPMLVRGFWYDQPARAGETTALGEELVVPAAVLAPPPVAAGPAGQSSQKPRDRRPPSGPRGQAARPAMQWGQRSVAKPTPTASPSTE